MNQQQKCTYLLEYLLHESDEYRGTPLPDDAEKQWQLVRALMNVRPAKPASGAFLEVQDAYLQEEVRLKGIVDVEKLPVFLSNPQLALWQGDITRLKAGVIVNAANGALQGCFIPGHHCIDNAIHTYAGVQLRLKCAELIERQGHEEPTGHAQITDAYNLPCEHVIHTVGPIVFQELSTEDCALLASCYRSCLTLAHEHKLGSIVFCCISTGAFHFPPEKAAEIALTTVLDFLQETSSPLKVIFNVFNESDYAIYQRLLKNT